MKVRLIHWRESEAADLVRAIESAGHQCLYGLDPGASTLRLIRSEPADVVVIDLSRVPSHGREVAVAMRASKSLRALPIVFLDGVPEKVAAVKQLLPDAIYTRREELAEALRKAKAPAHPVVPTPMMERYAGRTVAQKLGIARDSTVALIDAPREAEHLLGDLPEGAELVESAAKASLVVWFVTDADALLAALPRMVKLASRSRLWVARPKPKDKEKLTLNEQFIRENALGYGLVDYKICSLGERWSAIALAVRKELRSTAAHS